MGKLSNGWTDWHQLSFTYADSSGNGHRLNTIRPTTPHGHIGGGGFRGSQIQMFGEAVKRLDRLAPIWYKSADSSWNRHRLNTIRPSIPQDILGGHKFKSLLKLSNGWTDWRQIWHTCADSSGNGYTPNKLTFETQGGALGGGGGVRGSNIQKY